jgi:galactokinase
MNTDFINLKLEMKELIAELQSTFSHHFGTFQKPLIVFSPGRINLIGEHTDYNDGWVLPAAIDKGVYVAIAKSEGNSSVIAVDLQDRLAFYIKDILVPIKTSSWKNYVLGVVHQLKLETSLNRNFNIVIMSNLPLGSGISSSAALENAVGFGLQQLFDLPLTKIQLARLSQKAEHEFIGVQCGIMDQLASMMGQKDHVMLLDCKSLDMSFIPLELKEYTLLLCNSSVKHSLASSEYNKRRAECLEGIQILQKQGLKIESLRDVGLDDLKKYRKVLPELIYRRCKYVIEENKRVHSFVRLLEVGDFVGAGDILFQGHEGLRADYEVSCPEIDFMVDFAKSSGLVAGARQMGAGFGGCTLNLLRKEAVDSFLAKLEMAYSEEYALNMTPIEVGIGDGTRVIEA